MASPEREPIFTFGIDARTKDVQKFITSSWGTLRPTVLRFRMLSDESGGVPEHLPIPSRLIGKLVGNTTVSHFNKFNGDVRVLEVVGFEIEHEVESTQVKDRRFIHNGVETRELMSFLTLEGSTRRPIPDIMTGTLSFDLKDAELF